MSSSSRQGNLILSVLWSFVILALICGCSLIPPVNYHKPVQLEYRIDVPYQPFRVEQYCINTPYIFPVRLFHQAARALAERDDASINVNSGGMAVYVNLITHDSIQGTVLSYTVPVFPADPLPPPPALKSDDPYQNAANQQAYQKAFDGWQGQLIHQHKNLAGLLAQVKEWTNKLRSLAPPYDPIADDLYGCLVDASQHFQNVNSEKYLFIASPLINNTPVNETSTISLAGVNVRVIYRTCTNAASCAASDAYWTHLFQQFGASSVKILDPAQSEVEKPTF